MKIFNCLIVDDEPPAIRLLKKYVSKIPFLELVEPTTSSIQALSLIEQSNIDLASGYSNARTHRFTII